MTTPGPRVVEADHAGQLRFPPYSRGQRCQRFLVDIGEQDP